MRRVGEILLAAVAVALAQPAAAEPTWEHPAAILVYPRSRSTRPAASTRSFS